MNHVYRLKYKYIAIDFDGTIAKLVPHPEIGDLIPLADIIIRMVYNHGGKIAIWTCRSGDDVIKVKNYLDKYNIPYHKFNENFDEMLAMYKDDSRKICADVYIDDKALPWVGKEINWLEIKELLFERID